LSFIEGVVVPDTLHYRDRLGFWWIDTQQGFKKLLLPLLGRETALPGFVFTVKSNSIKNKSGMCRLLGSGCVGKRAILHSTSYN